MRTLLVATCALSLAALAVACSSEEQGGDVGGADAGRSDGSSGSSGSPDAAGTPGAPDAGGGDAGGDASATAPDAGPFTLASTAFAEGASIPSVHACTGANTSPALSWSGAPAGTQSYAIVMRDLSLGGSGNYHWVIYDIPASVTSLAAGVPKQAAPPTPAGAKQTHWSFSADPGYFGPCPPSLHTYRFEVLSFAAATVAVPGGTTSPGAADAILQAAKTSSATLTGTFQQ